MVKGGKHQKNKKGFNKEKGKTKERMRQELKRVSKDDQGQEKIRKDDKG